MFLAVWVFISLAVTTVVYSWLGQGGGVAGLVFFGTMLIGVIVSVVMPVLNPPGPERPRA